MLERERLARQRMRSFSALAAGCGVAVVAPLVLLALVPVSSSLTGPAFVTMALAGGTFAYKAVRFAYRGRWDSAITHRYWVAEVRSGALRRDLTAIAILYAVCLPLVFLGLWLQGRTQSSAVAAVTVLVICATAGVLGWFLSGPRRPAK